jgi:Helix-turn-helix domain of resolvase
MLDSGEHTVTAIAELQGVARFTVYRVPESESNAE